MKNKYISLFLIILALLIVAVIAIEYVNSKPKKAKQNPFEYNVDEFKQVDPKLISHAEKRQIKVKLNGKAGITTFDGKIYLAANNTVSVISPEGKLLSSFNASDDTRAIAVSATNIAIAEKNQVSVFDHAGNFGYSTAIVSDSSVFTSLAFWDGDIVVADAGKRRIYIFEKEKLIAEIEGISGIENLHGFIIPSARFDLAVNDENELWVVNPGMHALQQYTRRGALAGSWDKASLSIEGFSGCCNPAQICTLSEGRIVTSEKSMPRIKIYSRNGEMLSVVAPPTVFGKNVEASEVAAIGETIVALDTEQQLIRIFEKKTDILNE
jgi:lipopolysaccharide export system protein LptC